MYIYILDELGAGQANDGEYSSERSDFFQRLGETFVCPRFHGHWTSYGKS